MINFRLNLGVLQKWSLANLEQEKCRYWPDYFVFLRYRAQLNVVVMRMRYETKFNTGFFGSIATLCPIATNVVQTCNGFRQPL